MTLSRQRKSFASLVELELRSALDEGGVAGGFAAAILAEAVDDHDPDAQRALLAAAHVAPLELEVARVERFLDAGKGGAGEGRRVPMGARPAMSHDPPGDAGRIADHGKTVTKAEAGRRVGLDDRRRASESIR